MSHKYRTNVNDKGRCNNVKWRLVMMEFSCLKYCLNIYFVAILNNSLCMTLHTIFKYEFESTQSSTDGVCVCALIKCGENGRYKRKCHNDALLKSKSFHHFCVYINFHLIKTFWKHFHIPIEGCTNWWERARLAAPSQAIPYSRLQSRTVLNIHTIWLRWGVAMALASTYQNSIVKYAIKHLILHNLKQYLCIDTNIHLCIL